MFLDRLSVRLTVHASGKFMNILLIISCGNFSGFTIYLVTDVK